MSNVSTLHNIARQLTCACACVENTEDAEKLHDDIANLKGFGEHFLYLITFGQVHKGKERVSLFVSLMGNMVGSPKSKDDAVVCTFRDPTNNDNRIRVEILQTGIQMEAFNKYTNATVANFHLSTPIDMRLAPEIRKNLIREHIYACTDSDLRLISNGCLCKDLRKQDLSGINFSTLNISHKDLRDANLSDANLYGVDLSGTFLDKANLVFADLRGVTLPTRMEGAVLWGAKISRENYDWAAKNGALVDGAEICSEEVPSAKLPYPYVEYIAPSCRYLYSAKNDR